MAVKSLCSVAYCGKVSTKRGCCEMHYRRLLRHGDPTAGRSPNGEQMRYLEKVVLTYEGDECLPWPFSRDQNGVGLVNSGAGSRRVPRIVCEAHYGPPPSPGHEAAHSCGNGHLACVNKRHLSWKTHAGNMADMIAHGTSPKGERHGMAKLSEADVMVIRSLKGRRLQREIAAQFGVRPSMISMIHSGKSWGWL